MNRARLLAAFLIVAAAWGGALYLHRRDVTRTHTSFTRCEDGRNGINLELPPCRMFSGTVVYRPSTGPGWAKSAFSRGETRTVGHPAWEDPVALALVIGSVGVGLAVAPLRRPR